MNDLKSLEKIMYEDMDKMAQATSDFENAFTKRTQEWEKRKKSAKRMAGARGKMGSLIFSAVICLIAVYVAYLVFIK